MPEKEKTILLTLKVPASFKKKIDQKVQEGGFGTMANYIRTLLRGSFEGADSKPIGNAISMITWDKDGSNLSFCMVNDDYARLHGYTIDEMVGKPLEMVYPDSTRTSLKNHLSEIGKKGSYTFASEHMRKDGSTFQVVVDVRAVMDDSGERRFCIATVSPVHLQKCKPK